MKYKNKLTADRLSQSGLQRCDEDEDYMSSDVVMPVYIVNENGGSNYTQSDDRIIEFDDVEVTNAINIKPEKAPLRVHRVNSGIR